MIKKTNIVLSKTAWKKLVAELFERDGKCMIESCGSLKQETWVPHHLRPVSRGRIDALWNLLTLCHDCHMKLHGGELDVSVNDLIEVYKSAVG